MPTAVYLSLFSFPFRTKRNEGGRVYVRERKRKTMMAKGSWNSIVKSDFFRDKQLFLLQPTVYAVGKLSNHFKQNQSSCCNLTEQFKKCRNVIAHNILANPFTTHLNLLLFDLLS